MSEAVQVDGLDLSRRMVELARSNAKRSGLDIRLNFFICDGNFLAVSDKSYDMVISTGVLHSLRNPVTFINECHRVLKQGGEAWILDPAKITPSDGPLIQKERKKSARLLLFLGIASIMRVLRPQQYTPEKLRVLLKKTRFVNYTISGEEYFHITLIK